MFINESVNEHKITTDQKEDRYCARVSAILFQGCVEKSVIRAQALLWGKIEALFQGFTNPFGQGRSFINKARVDLH